MTITSYQVQNILRTYAKQLSRGQRLARARRSMEAGLGNEFALSIEARRKQVIEKITAEIVANLGSRLPGMGQAWGGVEEQALAYLAKEYGQPLDIYQDESTGQLMFNVVNAENGEVVQYLSSDESARLQNRLYTITQGIVDNNML